MYAAQLVDRRPPHSPEFSMFGKSFPIVLAAAMAASSVQAGEAAKAQLQSASGQVLVIQSKGVAAGHSGEALAAGDRVLVKTGQASVRFADGCAVALKAGSMATIGAVSPCAGGAGLVSVQAAEPAAFGEAFKHITPGGVLAAAGSVILVGAVIDGVINADHRCNSYQNANCTTSP
jgi:hypothetical protein